MQSLDIMPLLQPHRFNRPKFLGGNSYGQYEAADEDFPVPCDGKTPVPAFVTQKEGERRKT
jgi:hypothetical protein